MRSRSNFKIHTVFIISLAFIFILRLLFVNITLFTSLRNSPAGKPATSHLSDLFKVKKRDAEAVVKSRFDIYSAVEVCEEDSDNEESLAKASTAVLLSFLYFFFNRTLNAQQLGNPFYLTKYSLYPKKYLALSILRI